MGEQRRKPGEVRDAILDVLRNNSSGAGMTEIYEGVRSKIGQVSPSSVRSYVGLAAKRGELTRVGHGRYKLPRGR